MGSWANSLHVKHEDAAAVAEAVQALVSAAGYRLEPGRVAIGAGQDWSEAADAGEAGRGISVQAPIQGWVGVLDSGDIHALARDLSARLATDTLVVMVNDSDSWFYELYRKGEEIDNFHSSGEEDDSMSPELQAAMERGDENEIDRLLMQQLLANAQKGPIVLHDGAQILPPEIVLLREKIQEGRASWWERLRYRWLQVRLLFLTLTGRGDFGFDVPRAQPLSGVELQAHIQRLRQVFPEASAAALNRLLPQSRFPAEDLLADFLAIVGLAPLYAQLSYDYLEEFGSDELADEGIVEAARMRFVAPESSSW